MTTQSPTYATIVLFGKEHRHSVIDRELFPRLVESLTAFAQRAGCPISYRGLIEDARGRNNAPRKGPASAKLLRSWQERLAQGTFKQIEIFDSAWSKEHFPTVYAALTKLWDYQPTGYVERTMHGAENNITFAIRSDLLADQLEQLEAYARELASMTGTFYGFIEREVPWDREVMSGGAWVDMIDVRWHNRSEVDYRRGKYRMDTLIPRLYWGNILAASHFRDGGPATLPSSAVAHVETWADNLFYVRLAHDPLVDPQFGAAIAPYFNMIPT